MGRAYGSLMADDVFHEVMYNAESADDVISGLHEFLDKAWLLPPDEWDPTIRIDPPTLKADARRENVKGRRVGQSYGISFGDGGFKWVMWMSHTQWVKPIFRAGGHDTGDELKRTGRFCGGLIDDIKRKAPFIANGSDFIDALNLQSGLSKCELFVGRPDLKMIAIKALLSVLPHLFSFILPFWLQ